MAAKQQNNKCSKEKFVVSCPHSLGHFQYIESQQGQYSHGDFICPMTE